MNSTHATAIRPASDMLEMRFVGDKLDVARLDAGEVAGVAVNDAESAF